MGKNQFTNIPNKYVPDIFDSKQESEEFCKKYIIDHKLERFFCEDNWKSTYFWMCFNLLDEDEFYDFIDFKWRMYEY